MSPKLLHLILVSYTVCCFGTAQQEQNCGIDLVFLVDGSSSVGQINFNKSLEFVTNIVNTLKIGPYDAQVGLIIFNWSPLLQFYLNTYTDKQDVLNHLLSITYTGGGTATHLALDSAQSDSFTSSRGVRTTAARVAVVLTDGKSMNERLTALEAQRLRDKGVTVFAIGVGGGPKLSELNAIASNTTQAVFSLNDFNGLSTILNELQDKACQTEAPNFCDGQADIVFLLDESGSIGLANFRKMLDFVLDVVQDSIIGPNEIRVGLDTFSDGFRHHFYLKNSTDKVSLRNLISSISYSRGSTDTGEAIRKMRLESFAASAGHRSGVPKIAIVMTDGQSDNQALTSSEAQKARDDGIVILAVGIGDDVDQAELKAIVFDRDSLYNFWAAAFDALPGLSSFVASKMCAIVKPPSSSPLACGQQADIVFLIDNSGSVGPDNFKLLLNFIKTFLEDLQIGPDNIRVGVAKFSSRPYNEFNLDRFSNKTDLMAAINDIEYGGGGSDTAAAIKYMDTTMFTSASGDRSGVPKIGVIITDGKSNKPEETKAAADRAKAKGITIFSVGVGDEVSRSELNDIATDPDNRHVLTVKEFNKLSAIRAAFQVRACQAISTPVNTSIPPVSPAPPDTCQDAISNCASYPGQACTSFKKWASTFCAKTCGVCTTPSTPIAEPPCEDSLPNCFDYSASTCAASNTSWAIRNCRRFCGFCSPGIQDGLSLNKCFYKGQQYDQGDQWSDGCAYECECADASTGQYVCYNRCPSYYNLPTQCSLVREQGKCCLEPVCTFSLSYGTRNTSSSCVYNNYTYNVGQIWSIGCQFQCICLAEGSYVCQSKCAYYYSLPSNCKLVKRPGECCEKPLCEFETQIGYLTGSGFTNRQNVTSSIEINMCIYKGQMYQQGEAWYDGCDKLCTCDNATLGYVSCEDRCPDFLNLPAGCSMVRVSGQCCRLVYCDSPATFTSAQANDKTARAVISMVPDPQPGEYPTLPPDLLSTLDPAAVSSPAPLIADRDRIDPPLLTCDPVEEGKVATLTCAADLASCPHLFLMSWSADSRDIATCTSSICGGSFSKRSGINVTMGEAGSTLTLQNLTRDSPWLDTLWGCEFCGGSPVTLNTFVFYAKPENPNCSLTSEIDEASSKVKAITLMCSTSRVYPAAKCSFERTNGGETVPITATQTYTHIPTGEALEYYRSECSVSVSAEELGEGTHTFNGYVYPDVADGKSLVNAFPLQTTISYNDDKGGTSAATSLHGGFIPGLGLLVLFIRNKLY